MTTWTEKGRIGVAWNVEISDLRRLKGFHIAYCEVTSEALEKRLLNDETELDETGGSNRDQADGKNDNRNDDENNIDDHAKDVWSYVYVPYSQESSGRKIINTNNNNGLLLSAVSLKPRMHALVDVRPFRKYAFYVKADLMVDTNWVNRSSVFEYDKVMSRIVRVTSLPARKYN